jgi:hypothetical protein
LRSAGQPEGREARPQQRGDIADPTRDMRLAAAARKNLAVQLWPVFEPLDRGPNSKGERTGKAVTVAIPFGTSDICPVRAVQHWLIVAGITEGPIFRRIWRPRSRARDQDGKQGDSEEKANHVHLWRSGRPMASYRPCCSFCGCRTTKANHDDGGDRY